VQRQLHIQGIANMAEKPRLNVSQWTELLAKKELPAITSVACTLDKFANDDISSIPELSKAILHDQGLSSCLLKVVNTSQHAAVRKVTTVSRAAIVLGIHAVKNICLTSKILDGLLQSKNLLPEVYDRLLMLMANAFYAGLLAKMMVPDYQDDTQEEVYLAAMLYNIGETAFWSTGNELTEQLIRQASSQPAEQFSKYCAVELGVRFDELSAGLARTWNLGDLLIKSLDEPQSRTVEMQTISLANQLSAAIHSPPQNKADFNRIMTEICRVMKIEQRQLTERIGQTRQLAINLLGSYGAAMLQSHIRPLPTNADYNALLNPVIESVSPEKAVLQTLQQLNKLTQAGANINDLLAVVLLQSAQIFSFDRCAFWILTADKSRLESRSAFDSDGQSDTMRRVVALQGELNLFSLVVKKDNAILVNQPRHEKWRDYVSPELEKLLANGTICIVPVKINGKLIGVISGQLLQGGRRITEDNFAQFSFVIEHLTMCLSMSAQR
jgi:HD-like signal output (HDOD) protein